MKPIILLVLLLFAGAPVASAAPKEAPKEAPLVIGPGTFAGVKERTPLKTLQAKFGKKLKKEVEETGEGQFEYYGLRDEGGTEIARFYLVEGKVHRLEVVGSEVKTTKGVGVGSSYSELKAAYPDLKVSGSEIEGRTTASSAATKLAFVIDVNFWKEELSDKELASIPDATKVLSVVVF